VIGSADKIYSHTEGICTHALTHMRAAISIRYIKHVYSKTRIETAFRRYSSVRFLPKRIRRTGRSLFVRVSKCYELARFSKT